MSDATARPWRIQRGLRESDRLRIRSHVPNDDLYDIALLSSTKPSGFLPKTVEANAALIVKAVNAHDPLVAALRKLIDRIDYLQGPTLKIGLLDGELAAARAAVEAVGSRNGEAKP